MTVFHISAECYPIAKVGGLADVVGSLPKYQNGLGIESSVIMPFYNNAFTDGNKFKSIFEATVFLGHNQFDFQVLTLAENNLGYPIYFINIPSLLYRPYVYSSEDTERFLAFQIAALDWINTHKELPDVIHCHDHHTGLVPFMMSQSYKYKKLSKTPSIITIHNAQYQGWFSHDKVYMIPEFDFNQVGLIDWNHMVNPLAAGIKSAWKVTTVSPNYMNELKYAANGLEDLLQYESGKCTGILNGIDTDVWDPKTDNNLIKNYTDSSHISGKKANKEWLCENFDLSPDKPLFVFVGRLVGEKGADLFPGIFDLALRENDINILLLGSGEDNVEYHLDLLKYKYPKRYNCYIGYNEKLAHIMYAGGDFLLMPSRVEPCGLNQLYALRYGTVPVVSNVGGLHDTVKDISLEDGFGFVHDHVNVLEVAHAIHRAASFYANDQKNFKKVRKVIMQKDHSWEASAKAYIELYKSLN